MHLLANGVFHSMIVGLIKVVLILLLAKPKFALDYICLGYMKINSFLHVHYILHLTYNCVKGLIIGSVYAQFFFSARILLLLSF